MGMGFWDTLRFLWMSHKVIKNSSTQVYFQIHVVNLWPFWFSNALLAGKKRWNIEMLAFMWMTDTSKKVLVCSYEWYSGRTDLKTWCQNNWHDVGLFLHRIMSPVCSTEWVTTILEPFGYEDHVIVLPSCWVVSIFRKRILTQLSTEVW